MKKNNYFVFGLVAAMLSVGLFSCSNDKKSTTQKESSQIQNKLVFNVDAPIGSIENGSATALFSTTDFKMQLLQHDFFAEVERIELNQKFLTIIGKDKDNFSLVAWQFRLRTIGDQLFFPPIDQPNAIMTIHKCEGTACSSCDFIRENTNEIKGCKCESSTSEQCNHYIQEDDDNSKLPWLVYKLLRV